MGPQGILVMAISIVGVMAFIPHGSIGVKDHIFTEVLLREVVDRMGKDLNDAASTYFEYPLRQLEFPPSERRLELPPSERRLELPPNERRLELPPSNRRLEFPTSDRRIEFPTSERRIDFPTSERRIEFPTNERRIEFPTSERRMEFPTSERRLEFSTNERLALMARANKELEHEQLDYDSLLDGNPSPSLRDQEYLQHSSLFGHQYVTGGAGEGEQRLLPSGVVPNRQMIKTDAVLPAYCNPPNPCPVGYTEEQGCISDFENTAAFSREYQLAQRCMCDGEHMFSCPPEPPSELNIRFTDHHKNLVAKKYKMDVENPHLLGQRLPIAAKKGFDLNVY